MDKSSIDESENKKWLISRIDRIHETVYDQITSMEHRFDELGKKELSRLRGRRNDILYGLGIILTLLIAVRQSSTNVDLFPWIIITGLVVGFTLIVFNIYIGLQKDSFYT